MSCGDIKPTGGSCSGFITALSCCEDALIDGLIFSPFSVFIGGESVGVGAGFQGVGIRGGFQGPPPPGSGGTNDAGDHDGGGGGGGTHGGDLGSSDGTDVGGIF